MREAFSSEVGDIRGAHHTHAQLAQTAHAIAADIVTSAPTDRTPIAAWNVTPISLV
jgi:hypothetical protein